MKQKMASAPAEQSPSSSSFTRRAFLLMIFTTLFFIMTLLGSLFIMIVLINNIKVPGGEAPNWLMAGMVPPPVLTFLFATKVLGRLLL